MVELRTFVTFQIQITSTADRKHRFLLPQTCLPRFQACFFPSILYFNTKTRDCHYTCSIKLMFLIRFNLNQLFLGVNHHVE